MLLLLPRSTRRALGSKPWGLDTPRCPGCFSLQPSCKGRGANCSRRARTVHAEPQHLPAAGSLSPTDALREREFKRAVTELPSPAPCELPHAALFTALRKTREVCKYFPRRENIDFHQRELRAEALALNKREMTKQRLLSLSCRQLGLILGRRPHPRGGAGAEPGGTGRTAEAARLHRPSSGRALPRRWHPGRPTRRVPWRLRGVLGSPRGAVPR